MSSTLSNNGNEGQNGGGNVQSQNWIGSGGTATGTTGSSGIQPPGIGVIGSQSQLEKPPGDSINSSGNNQNYEHCVNCRKPFVSQTTGAVLRQCNTKLFLFKTTETPAGSFNNEVSFIPILESISYIFGERFNVKKLFGNDGASEIPLCTGCTDVVQRLYILHKEFREMCHPDSHFQSLLRSTCMNTITDTNTNGGNNIEQYESSDMIVPAIVYGGKVQEDEEGDDDVVFMGSPNMDNSDDEDGESYSNTNAGRTRNRKRKGKSTLAASPKRKAVRKSPNPKKPETPRAPPKKVKPRASLKSIVEKIKQKRLISKANVEFEVEQLEWKRRRFENSLHLFRIKQGRKANAAYLAGQQETVGTLWKFPQGHPKMRANEVIPRVPCPDCGKTSNKRFLEVHRNVMHRKIPAFVCNTCGRKCRDFENLKMHLSTHWHSRNTRARRPVLVKERRTDMCLLCGRTYKKSCLNLHLAIHGIPRRFNCKKCDSRFENSRDLKDHQVVHEEGGYYAFKCDSCTQGFKIESFLIQHHLVCEMRAVDRPFRCTFCEKRFKLKHHLESHLFEVHRLSKEESRGMVYPGLAKRTVNRKKK